MTGISEELTEFLLECDSAEPTVPVIKTFPTNTHRCFCELPRSYLLEYDAKKSTGKIGCASCGFIQYAFKPNPDFRY